MKSQLILYALISAIILLASCSKNNSTGPDPDPDPNPNPNVVSKNIGPDGGEITSSDGLLTLTIPVGALANTETITITPIGADDLGPEFDEIEVEMAYEFGPDGLVFESPITVVYQVQNDNQNDSLEVTFPGLLTEQEEEAIALENLVYDGEKITGQLKHFSPLVVEKSYATATIRNLPAQLEVGQNVFLEVEVRINTPIFKESFANPPGGGKGKVFYADVNGNDEFKFMETTTYFPVELEPGFDGEVEFFKKSVAYSCVKEGIDVYSGGIYVWIEKENAEPDTVSSFTIELPLKKHGEITVECVPKSSVGSIIFGLGVLPAVVTYVETILLLPFLNYVLPPGSQNKMDNSFMTQMAEDRLPLLVQGAEGFIVFDLISNELMLDFTNVVGNNTTELRTPLGALAISRPNPGPDTPSVIASYGQDNAFYTFGFSLYPYDTQNNEYIKGPVSPYPSTVDAFPVGGESISDEVIIVREGGSGINFLRYNSVSDEYLFGPSNETLVSARYGFEQPVTAYGEFVDGPLLVVNIKGDLYFEPRNRLIYSPSVLIGNLGERIIRIRCELPVCVATDFEGNTVRIITWDGETAPSIVGNPISVGSGPVDPDLYTLPDGRILIAVTGFNDNTISLIKVDSGGNILANTLYEAPQGCENPGHVIIEDNPDDAANPLIIGSCFESANYFVNDIMNSSGLFPVIGGI